MKHCVNASISGADYSARGRLYVNITTGTLVACVLVGNMYLKQVHVELEEVEATGLLFSTTMTAIEAVVEALNEGYAISFAMSASEAFIREPLNLPLPWFMFTRNKGDYSTPRLYF